MTDGYRALRETAGQIDLSARGRIRVTGDDRVRLLHAMTTNNVNDLVPGQGCYAFFLNAQGRIQADANILCFDDHLLLDTEQETRRPLLEHLDKYIIADDVVLEDVTESTFSIGVEGPQSAQALKNAGLPVPEAPLSHVFEGALTVTRATATGAAGFRLIGKGERPVLRVPVASADDARIVRLENFFPRFGEEVTDANLAQETQIAGALHFNKGCYLGQEIVERVRSRGHVNRMLAGLRIAGAETVSRGAKVLSGDEEEGEVVSAAFSPAQLLTVGMAYIRVTVAKPGTQVTVNGRTAQVEAIKSSRT